MAKTRKCLYHGNKFLFHRWFQEGGFEEFETGPENEMDIGAILENPYTGKIKKVFDIEQIEFKEELDNE
jgi:hypothetical protein